MSALSRPRSPGSSGRARPAARATACGRPAPTGGEIKALEVVEAEVQAGLVGVARLDLFRDHGLFHAVQLAHQVRQRAGGTLRRSSLTKAARGSRRCRRRLSPSMPSSAKRKPWPQSRACAPAGRRPARRPPRSRASSGRAAGRRRCRWRGLRRRRSGSRWRRRSRAPGPAGPHGRSRRPSPTGRSRRPRPGRALRNSSS
jgi:hypothetical protein